MEMSLIYTCLIILVILVALNLKLTLHLFELIKDPSILNPPFLPRQLGDEMPELLGSNLDKQPVALSEVQQASVLLFLSSKCPKCKEKLIEIKALLPLLENAGLTMFLVTNEPKRHIAKFLENNDLLDKVFTVDNKSYKQINPTLSTPYYLFVNHLNQLEAGGVIGDEDWLSFIEQMDEIRQQEAVA